MDTTLLRFALMLAGLFFLTWMTLDEGPWTALSVSVLGLYTITTFIDVIILKRQNKRLEKELKSLRATSKLHIWDKEV